MGIKTWEDLTAVPSKVEIDRDANTMTVTLDLELDAGKLLANLPRPVPMRHDDDRQLGYQVPM
jgi:hypothetical protein